jgi:hypothetical protein
MLTNNKCINALQLLAILDDRETETVQKILPVIELQSRPDMVA